MTEIQQTASLNRERLLTMSTHPNQIQTDSFCPTLPTQYKTR